MLSPGLHPQPLQLCDHTLQLTIVGTSVWINSREAAPSLCNGVMFEAKNKIKDKTLPPNISCSPSLRHSSTRFTNSKLNYRSEKKDSYSPSENRSHTLPRASDDQPQDQDSTLVIPACSASSDKATSVRGLQGTLPSSALKIATRAYYTSSSWWTKAQQLQSS